jgi:hypothetical protein
MKRNLQESHTDRQNILNNPFAVEEIQNRLGIQGVQIEDRYWITTNQVAEYFEVDLRTIRRAIENYQEELSQNGYKIFTGKDLEIAKNQLGSDIDVLTKTTVLGMFDFRSFLNLGMLLTTSEKAKELRSVILDIFIEVMDKNFGKNRKYINQKHPKFNFAIKGYNFYHRKLNDALSKYVDMPQTKYIYFNNRIYEFLFLEKAKEYRILLELNSKEKSIDTHYPEVITTISAFDTDFAQEIKEVFVATGRRLFQKEVEEIFDKLIRRDRWEPLLNFSRQILASRDNAFRATIHTNLDVYKKHITADEYQIFAKTLEGNNPLTENEKLQFQKDQTQSLFEEIEADKQIYIRLKDK